VTKFLCIAGALGLASRLRDQKNIVVHSLCPGTTRTGFWDGYPNGSRAVVDFWAKIGMTRSLGRATSNVILGN
jgi:short-subunit dehydrogenase